MLTGGFRTVTTMKGTIADGEFYVVGIARPFTLYPDLPNRILSGEITYLNTTGFIDTMRHEVNISRLGKGGTPNPKLSAYTMFGHNLTTTIKKLTYNR